MMRTMMRFPLVTVLLVWFGGGSRVRHVACTLKLSVPPHVARACRIFPVLYTGFLVRSRVRRARFSASIFA